MSDNALDEKCRAKEREWREALMEKRDSLQVDRDRLTALCEALTSEKERVLQDIQKHAEENTRVIHQRDALAQELRRARRLLQDLVADKERSQRRIERCECELKAAEDAHRREKNNFQEISQSLAKEVELLNSAHAKTLKEINTETNTKLAQIIEEKSQTEIKLNENIKQLQYKIKERDDETKHLYFEIQEKDQELNTHRNEQITLNAMIEKNSKTVQDYHQRSDVEMTALKQKLQDNFTENKLLKDENHDYRSKVLNLEQKLQNAVSENLNLRCIQTDNGYKKEILDKKLEDMNFERQKLLTELECIKSHPVLMELDRVKQQNDVLRNVILEQKQIILKFNSEKELMSQRIMINMGTQTETKLKEIRKHDCIQRNIDAVKDTKDKNIDSQRLKEDEKRIQDLENVVFILKHTLVEKVKNDLIEK